MDTSHTLRKVQMYKYKTSHGKYHYMCHKLEHRMAKTLYTLETRFFRYLIVSTPDKGDKYK